MSAKRLSIFLVCAAVVLAVASQLVSLFVIQPIGAVPEGRTIVVTRQPFLNFIDSADAVCERRTGSVNLLCRGIVAAQVAKSATIVARLPYSATLYGISTGGKFYDR